jgi:flagellar capping protein FliD
MSMSPMGMGGGLDINSMVSKIVESERLPKQQRDGDFSSRGYVCLEKCEYQ